MLDSHERLARREPGKGGCHPSSTCVGRFLRMRCQQVAVGMSVTIHSSVPFCASQAWGRLVLSPVPLQWYVVAKSPLLAIHSVLTA